MLTESSSLFPFDWNGAVFRRTRKNGSALLYINFCKIVSGSFILEKWFGMNQIQLSHHQRHLNMSKPGYSDKTSLVSTAQTQRASKRV